MEEEKKTIKTVFVACGSKDVADPQYRRHAEELGRRLAEAGYDIVYGGGNSGLMGAVARAAVAAGGKVKGYITRDFKDAVWYAPVPGVEEEVVEDIVRSRIDSMVADRASAEARDILTRTFFSLTDPLGIRKSLLLGAADAVIILAGGVGTFDEQWTGTANLDMDITAGRDSYIKPIFVLNTDNYYHHSKEQMKHAIATGFTQPGRESIIKSVKTPEGIMEQLQMRNEQGLMRASELAARAAASTSPASPPAGPLPDRLNPPSP